MTHDKEYVNELFQAIQPGDIADVTTKDGEWIIIHIIAPDGDGTHYSLWIKIDGGRWELRNEDANDGNGMTVFRQLN